MMTEAPNSQTRTIKLRLRDTCSAELRRQARAVNFVWNYCNEVQQKAARAHRPWLSSFALQRLTNGAAQTLDLHAHTIQGVCKQYVRSRSQHRKAWLRFRGRKSLGWVPFNTGHVQWDGGAFVFRGRRYQPMHVRDLLLPGIKIGAGSFSQDARGRWYINAPIEVSVKQNASDKSVGLDLGLKSLVTTSDGQNIEAPRFYRASEQTLAVAQRARKTKRVRAIHAKAANRRKDHLHKVSKALVNEYGTIVVGDVSPKKLSRTRLAKSVHDAGWASFKAMLRYKSIANGGSTIEVDEAWTTQSCSACGSLPSSRPRGIAGLGIRGWTCSDCGAEHDRDVNAARNILRVGLDTLAEGARP